MAQTTTISGTASSTNSTSPPYDPPSILKYFYNALALHATSKTSRYRSAETTIFKSAESGLSTPTSKV